jgi:hypothetical protein
MRTKKHVLEHFKGDPWPVRMGVLVLPWIFILALAVLFREPAAPLLALLK